MVSKWYQNILTSLTALGEVSEDDGVLRGRKSENHSARAAMVAVASLEPVLENERNIQNQGQNPLLKTSKT